MPLWTGEDHAAYGSAAMPVHNADNYVKTPANITTQTDCEPITELDYHVHAVVLR